MFAQAEHTVLTMQVLEIGDPRWLQFAWIAAGSNIFHHPSWVKSLASCYGGQPRLICARGPAGEIQAGLPILETCNLWGRKHWMALPYSDHCIPLAVSSSAFQTVCQGMMETAKNMDVQAVEVRWSLPNSRPNTTSPPYVLHRLSLEDGYPLINRRFHSMHRRNIETALRRSVIVTVGTSQDFVDQYYRLHAASRRRQGVPVQPRYFFEKLRTELFEQRLGFILLAWIGARCIAGAVFFHWGETLTYKYGASDLENRSMRPNNLIFDEAIRWGCEAGYRWFDMGRSDAGNLGLRQFKTFWGAEEEPLSYTFFPPQSDHSHPARLEALLGNVLKRSPQWLCGAAGEIYYRYLGH
jgi:CelD/BcsL family acetyltransferase involved in cellulose biosynthesis